jgi:hypothetical protein
MSTIVEGEVLRAEGPIHRAFVRLLDAKGNFTAEVATEPDGAFRFFASPGDWTVRVISTLGTHDFPVKAIKGSNKVAAFVAPPA